MPETTCPQEFSVPVRVYIEDTDAGGIVYYVNYLKFLERARTEYFRCLGFDKPAFISAECLLVVAAVELKYCSPARLDDLLSATAKVSKLARTYVVFQQRILRDGLCLCDATVKIACVTRATMKPEVFPSAVTAALRQSSGGIINK